MMKAIIGLGNPERRYEQTRHNIGFVVIDHIAQKTCTSVTQKRFQALQGEFYFLGEKIVLLKPQTYMNCSGHAVRELMIYYKTSLGIDDMLVVFDDVALDFGTIRVRAQGSAGGHNGIKSVIDVLQDDRFARVKIGVNNAERISDLADFVLGKFTKDEQTMLPDIVMRAQEICFCWLEYGVKKTMNEVN